jgi:hypothetical protein
MEDNGMTNRETVECLSKVAQKIALAKAASAAHLRNDNFTGYSEIKEHLDDCQEMMAILCKCAPIKLIAGQVDDVLQNLSAEWLEK